MGSPSKMLLCLALFSLAAAGCVPSADNSCENNEVAMPRDESSLLQVHSSVSLANDRDESAATTTPAVFGTDKFGGGAKVTKVKLNSAVDIVFFMAAVKTDAGAFVFFCIVFMCLYRSCPEMLAVRSVVGYNPDMEDKDKQTKEWKTSQWSLQQIEDMPEWEDGLDENANQLYQKPADIFKKKNNWPAPKSCRFNAEASDAKERWCAWWHAAWGVNLWADDVHEAIGLDGAMLIVFSEMAMRILAFTGGPILLFLAPMYIWGGGFAAKKDVLSWQGVGNVWYAGNANTLEEKNLIDGVQWIWWVLAFATWAVVIYVQAEIFTFNSKFLNIRKRWLKAQPPPQSRTLLVELLPLPPKKLEHPDEPKKEEGSQAEESDAEEDPTAQKYWDDEYLKAYFEKLFPEQIASAFVVRKASELVDLVDNYAEVCPAGGDDLPKLRAQIEEAQADLKERKEKYPENYYSCNGFVTFHNTNDRDAAIYQVISDTTGEFEMSIPPLPNDVIFADLETDAEDRFINDRFADACIVGLFLAFMPIILFIGKCSSLATIESVPAIKHALKSSGMEATVGGVLASLGLTIMMSMLPTFLLAIFELYTLKSVSWRQLELQRWYYWFLVIFVMLVTCVGGNLTGTLETLANRPFGIFSLLANRMPLTTHFYLNYCMMQPLTHGMALTRYVSLIKYKLFQNAGFGQPGGGRSEAARFKSEPEDQDFFGLGSRSARFGFMLTLGLVYGTICPLMNAVVFFNFFCCRLVYGYLILCCESRKNDSGGEHWVLQCNQVSFGMLIYIILQVGVIANRSESSLPATLASASFFFWIVSYNKLKGKRWERLALSDIMIPEEKGVELRKSVFPEYTQNLDDTPGAEVYTVPYSDGKGEKVWVEHYATIP